MNEEVKSNLVAVDAIKIPKRFFETEWNVPERLNVDAVCMDSSYISGFSRRNEVVINPIAEWDILIYDGTEVKELELAVKGFIAAAQPSDYYGATKPKLQIKFEANLGEIWIKLIDDATGQEKANWNRTAELVVANLSNARPSVINEQEDDLPPIYYDLPVSVHGIITSTNADICSSMNVVYSRCFVDLKSEIDKTLAIFMGEQPKDKIKDLADEELELAVRARGRRTVPLTIDKLRYIGEGQPRLKLDEIIVSFDGEEATKEANLAEIIFGRPRDFTKTITYEEIFESLEGELGRKWLDLSKDERKNCIRDYRQRMRQLNYRIGSMLALGENKALTAIDSGIAINYKLLPD